MFVPLFSPVLEDLVGRMLQVQPDQRLGLKQVPQLLKRAPKPVKLLF